MVVEQSVLISHRRFPGHVQGRGSAAANRVVARVIRAGVVLGSQSGADTRRHDLAGVEHGVRIGGPVRERERTRGGLEDGLCVVPALQQGEHHILRDLFGEQRDRRSDPVGRTQCIGHIRLGMGDRCVCVRPEQPDETERGEGEDRQRTPRTQSEPGTGVLRDRWRLSTVDRVELTAVLTQSHEQQHREHEVGPVADGTLRRSMGGGQQHDVHHDQRGQDQPWRVPVGGPARGSEEKCHKRGGGEDLGDQAGRRPGDRRDDRLDPDEVREQRVERRFGGEVPDDGGGECDAP